MALCSLSDNSSETKMLENRIDKLVLNDTENNDNSQRLIMNNNDLDIIPIMMMLCERFGVGKTNVDEHRKEILRQCLTILQNTSKLADQVTFDRCEDVKVGHSITINEHIVINAATNEIETDTQKLRNYRDTFPMIDRMHWLAQPREEEINYLKKPAHYVIICHTATEEAYSQAKNILLLRLTQTFHIESQGWADIAYNFCVGCDGNVYEGRGWFAQGSHTLSYNAHSVGIGFIGCFLNTLPPPVALKKCQDLIAHGVEIGAISPDYELLAHCQCRPFLSPGNRLFKEIQTWPHYNPNVTNTSLCKLQEAD